MLLLHMGHIYPSSVPTVGQKQSNNIIISIIIISTISLFGQVLALLKIHDSKFHQSTHFWTDIAAGKILGEKIQKFC